MLIKALGGITRGGHQKQTEAGQQQVGPVMKKVRSGVIRKQSTMQTNETVKQVRDKNGE